MDKRIVLIVDDEETNLEIIEGYLKLGVNFHHQTLRCQNGKDAMDALKIHHALVDVILLDRMMPVMSGIEFLHEFNKNELYKKIPVIMQTASNDQEHLTEGFKLGVYHYLVKPYSPNVLNSVVKAAIDFYTTNRELSIEVNHSKTLFKYVDHATLKIKNLEEAKLLSVSLAGLFPNPEKVALGISEILINAIEHGNLGITYEDKTKLNLECKWKEEVQRRLALPENKDKEVIVSFFRTRDKIVLNARDQGKGFNYEKYLNFDPKRSTDNHGRGIAFANSLSFDNVEYVGCGNEVNCIVKLHPHL